MICAFALPLAALDSPEMNGPVNDLAGVLSAEEKASLTDYLTATNRSDRRPGGRAHRQVA